MLKMRKISSPGNIFLSSKENFVRRFSGFLGRGFLFVVTSLAAAAILFIIYFIAKDAVPFFQIRENAFSEFFANPHWYPSAEPVQFGVLAIIIGSSLVAFGAIVVAVPLGISASVYLSDVLPFSTRQFVKPVIEILAAIPSVAYGFFALVVFAPLLQQKGGMLLSVVWWVLMTPLFFLTVMVFSDLLTSRISSEQLRKKGRSVLILVLGGLSFWMLYSVGSSLGSMNIVTGTNALNVSIILGIMALPTVVSVSEDALQAVGRDLRQGSYALGATRAETVIKVILPAASSGILAAVLLGVMRALGETMVVWMASGNAAQIPVPWYNFLEPIRTLPATIAGDMGEADHVLGSARYHVLFAMGLVLLLFSLSCNLVSEWVVSRQMKKLRGGS
jgi:phosphate transport system permease protein